MTSTLDFWTAHFCVHTCKLKKRNPAELQLLNNIWLWSSSVIKIVKMKYNRIDIKWWHVSTSFKTYLEMHSNFYITFTIFYYNTSFKCIFFFCSSKRTLSNRIIQFTCNAVNTHLSHRRIFLFSTPCDVGSLLCMRNINCKPHWLAIWCLSRIFYFFLDRQFRSKKTIWWIFSVNHANNNICTWQNAFSRHRMDSSLWYKRMELIEVKS